MRFLGRRMQGPQGASWERLSAPRARNPPANFTAVPPAASIFRQHLEFAIILAGEAAAEAARLAKSAVVAAVTSKPRPSRRPIAPSRNPPAARPPPPRAAARRLRSAAGPT